MHAFIFFLDSQRYLWFLFSVQNVLKVVLYYVLIFSSFITSPGFIPETTGRKAESDIEEELEVLIRPLDELWFLWGIDSGVWSWFGNSLITPNVNDRVRGGAGTVETTFFFPELSVWTTCKIFIKNA